MSTLSASQVTLSREGELLILSSVTPKITYRVWISNLYILNSRLILNHNRKTLLEDLSPELCSELKSFGVIEEIRERVEKAFHWKSSVFDTSYYDGPGRVRSVSGQIYGSLGLFRAEDEHTSYRKIGWKFKLSPWVVVDLASGFAIGCHTSQSVAKENIEGAYEGETLRESVRARVENAAQEEKSKAEPQDEPQDEPDATLNSSPADADYLAWRSKRLSAIRAKREKEKEEEKEEERKETSERDACLSPQ